MSPSPLSFTGQVLIPGDLAQNLPPKTCKLSPMAFLWPKAGNGRIAP